MVGWDMAYLDFNATTPLDPRVREVFVDALARFEGNPASRHHGSGVIAGRALRAAREATAESLGVSPGEIVFTSGATEALSLAILGYLAGLPSSDRVVLVSDTEHKAALSAAEVAWHLLGARVVRIPVTTYGVPDLEQWRHQLAETASGLAVMMLVNNETGVIGPVGDLALIARERGVAVLCDATQALGKLPVDFGELGVDLAVISGHKFYGPKGAGALVASRAIQRRLVSVMPGGGQERGLRGGTSNTPALVAMGEAAQLAVKYVLPDSKRLGLLAARMSDMLRARVPDVTVVGDGAPRIGSTLCLHFPGADAEEVLAELKETEISAGSACSSGSPGPSHVLSAMGFDPRAAGQTLRVSLGRPTVWGDCAKAVDEIADAVALVRSRENRG